MGVLGWGGWVRGVGLGGLFEEDGPGVRSVTRGERGRNVPLHHPDSVRAQGRLNSCPLSWIHLFDTHLLPTRTGQAACLVL